MSNELNPGAIHRLEEPKVSFDLRPLVVVCGENLLDGSTAIGGKERAFAKFRPSERTRRLIGPQTQGPVGLDRDRLIPTSLDLLLQAGQPQDSISYGSAVSIGPISGHSNLRFGDLTVRLAGTEACR